MSDTTSQTEAGLADRLKAATAEQHRRAEERPLQRAMAGGTIDRPTYARWTLAMLAVHAALDEALAGLVDGRPDLDGLASLVQGHGRHVANLEADAIAARDAGHLPADAAVDRSTARAAVGPAARAIGDALLERAGTAPIGLLGSLYVLEGSMNGNRFIARKLEEAWGDRTGLAYLDPDGAEQRPRWMVWRAGLDELPLTPDEQAMVLDAAGAMFDGVGDLSDECAA